MQWRIISTKQTDDVTIIITNILQEINSHHSSDSHRLSYTNYQTAIALSTSIIIVRKIYFNAVICVYLVVLYLFCIKQSLSNLFSFHFQTKHSNTHAPTHSWSSNNAYMVTETSKTINFWACFFYNMFLYWIAIPFISIMFLCWQVFSGGLKKLTI